MTLYYDKTFVTRSFSNSYDSTVDFICHVNYAIVRSNIFKQLKRLSNCTKILWWKEVDTCCIYD